jgi:hypothetical protein
MLIGMFPKECGKRKLPLLKKSHLAITTLDFFSQLFASQESIEKYQEYFQVTFVVHFETYIV